LNFDKTPLHLVAELLNDDNLPTVFEIIQIFSKFGGDFSWPARRSDNQTPFQMLLEKLATLQDKDTCLQVIRYLIGKYPRIDKFQREKCANLIRQNFGELIEKYRVVESWSEKTDQVMDWESELVNLIKKNEAEFLVKFDVQKKINRENLIKILSKGELIRLSIDHGKYESFVEICGMYDFDIEKVAKRVLSFNRYRILKFFLNHNRVEHIDHTGMITILWQMEDKVIDTDPDTLKCFHIFLDHPKYDVNEQIPTMDNITALHFAATRSEYAVVELLKRGAALGIRNDQKKMAIQFIDNSILKKFFDSCVTTCIPEERSDIDYFMVIDYSFLKAPKEMPPIEYIAETKDVEELIEHPVIASFLFLKWLRLSNIFYLNLLYFSISAISFCIYLVLYFVHHYHQDETNGAWFQVLRILAYWSFFMFAFKESSQFIGSPKSYLKSLENYFEIIFLCLIGLVLFVPLEDQLIRRAVAAMLFLGFAVEWTMMFSALPMFSVSNYIVMLRKVAVNFLRTLAFYSIILLAFALSFYTLLNKSESDTGNSTTSGSNGTEESKDYFMSSTLFDVMLMLTGEFGDVLDKSEEIAIGRIFVLVFVLSMSIVMMNLLVGLTVSDTAAIEKEAEWHKWWERTKLLGKYECMAWNW
jgi:Ion transport protein